MRFLVDMGIAMDVVHAFRVRGHDVVHLGERGLERLPDPQILELAVSEERIVLTHDLDFGRLLSISEAARPSIITFRLSDMTPQSVEHRLAEVLQVLEQELLQGAAITVSDAAMRFHLLPIRPPRDES